MVDVIKIEQTNLEYYPEIKEKPKRLELEERVEENMVTIQKKTFFYL